MTDTQENHIGNGSSLSGVDGVHVVYKQLGETPLEALQRWRGEAPERATLPATYAGRLDPMAEGVLLILSGNAVHDKETYTMLSKTYVVDVLWGVHTDTYDILGLVDDAAHVYVKVPLEKEVREVIEKNVGTFTQTYPPYASKPVNGKPLFMWAREGKLGEITIPTHEVTLEKATFVSRKTISSKELLERVEENISRVKGDFRQKEIVEKWRRELAEATSEAAGKIQKKEEKKEKGKEPAQKRHAHEWIIDTLEFSVSSGFYVRQFISDIGVKLGVPATTFHIRRTQVGDFHI